MVESLFDDPVVVQLGMPVQSGLLPTDIAVVGGAGVGAGGVT